MNPGSIYIFYVFRYIHKQRKHLFVWCAIIAARVYTGHAGVSRTRVLRDSFRSKFPDATNAVKTCAQDAAFGLRLWCMIQDEEPEFDALGIEIYIVYLFCGPVCCEFRRTPAVKSLPRHNSSNIHHNQRQLETPLYITKAS